MLLIGLQLNDTGNLRKRRENSVNENIVFVHKLISEIFIYLVGLLFQFTEMHICTGPKNVIRPLRNTIA